ncbi:MAG TPA: TolC family outer membrane protein [Gammaproteobacteria bacterium]|nr:TolC family outer membrane protein [Gammaproteobacteria bacterium]
MSNRTLSKALRRVLAAAAGFVVSTTVSAATLEQALTQAWQNNPALEAQRDSLAAAGNRVDEAQGGYYPQVKLFGGLGTSHLDVSFMQIPGFPFPSNSIGVPLNTRQVGLEVDQNLYVGGRVSSGVDLAQNLRAAEDAKLHAIEESVLLQAAQAYMDVLQYTAVLSLEQSNERVLQEALEQAQASFDNGEVTHTDVDQAKARLAGAQAARIQAEGALTAAEANYERIIGAAPDALEQPTELNGLPTNQQDALALADRNYNVLVAQYTSAAAQSNVDIAESAMRPTLQLTGQVSKATEPQFLFEKLDTRSIMLNLSVPLYAGGSLTSQMHAAQHDAASSEQQALDARRQARDQVISAWQAYQTAIAGLAAIQVEITAAQSAYDGVQAEHKVGDRTTLDVLNAEQELLNAKVNQVRAQRDETVAEYALKAATGALTAQDLKLPVQTPVAGE